MQASPGYEPEPDELSDFNLMVMARIHQTYENHRLKMMAKMMGATDG